MPGTVLITGGAGRIGTTLRRGLSASEWTLRSIDRLPAERVSTDERIEVAEMADTDALESSLAGCDALVHLAALPTERPWPEILHNNIEGSYAVFEAARRAGVRRIVYASSVHASGFTPRTELVGVDEPARPDSLYGVSKVFGEALGRLYHDRYGIAVACVRIGAFQPRPTSVHTLENWLSAGDAVRLFQACLSAPELGYRIVYGRSDNARGWLDLAAARELGYRPQDDSEVFAASITGKRQHTDDFVGGYFLEPRFDVDAIENTA